MVSRNAHAWRKLVKTWNIKNSSKSLSNERKKEGSKYAEMIEEKNVKVYRKCKERNDRFSDLEEDVEI